MNILIAGHDLKFLNFYIEHLQDSAHDIKIDLWETHSSHDVKKSFEYLDWADIIFCEWGMGNIVFYSKNKRPHQKLLVRIHRQEMETTYMHNINIQNIDCIVTVSPYIYEEFVRIFNLPRDKMKLIYNHLDLTTLSDNKNPERKYNIGMLGYIPIRKRMDLALDIFEELYEQDNNYKLHFKGKSPFEVDWVKNNEDEMKYFAEQFLRIENSAWKNNVFFEGFGEVSEFYNKLEFVLSVSDSESFHLAVAEGMACGAIPIISNWEGSHTIYSKDYILSSEDSVSEYVENSRRDYEKIAEKIKIEAKQFDKNLIINEFNEVLFGKMS